jgi:hypothetical protein
MSGPESARPPAGHVPVPYRRGLRSPRSFPLWLSQLVSNLDDTVNDVALVVLRIFVGVIDPLNPRIETPQEVCERVLEAAEYIPLERLGTTDDCGFAPFGDDVSTARETAFAKIRARVAGTELAAQRLDRAMA